MLACVDMNADGDEKNGNEGEIYNRVNKYRESTRLHVPEFDHFVPPRYLQ